MRDRLIAFLNALSRPMRRVMIVVLFLPFLAFNIVMQPLWLTRHFITAWRLP